MQSQASLAGTVGVADGSAFVADAANSDTLAQASTLVAGALDDVALELALAVMLATPDEDEVGI